MNHDYRPEDEYEVVALRNTDRSTLDRALEDAELKIRRALELGPINIFCTQRGGLGADRTSIFVSGTSHAPQVGIDLHGLKNEAEGGNVPLLQVLRIAISTRLAQAFSEKIGIEAPDEEAAEEFAQAYVMEGLVDVDTLRYALERTTLKSRASSRR